MSRNLKMLKKVGTEAWKKKRKQEYLETKEYLHNTSMGIHKKKMISCHIYLKMLYLSKIVKKQQRIRRMAEVLHTDDLAIAYVYI